LQQIPSAISKNRRIRSAVAVIIGGRGNVRSVVIEIIEKKEGIDIKSIPSSYFTLTKI
jgi:hypothetical protein